MSECSSQARSRSAFFLFAFFFGVLLLFGPSAPAQTRPGSDPATQAAGLATLSGTVTDPSGALVAGASVQVDPNVDPQSDLQGNQGVGSASALQPVTTNSSGRFNLHLPPGAYRLTIQSPGFEPFIRIFTLAASPLRLDAKLAIAATVDQVDVPSDADASTASADNKSALVFKGDQLDALSDNDSILQQQVLAMAGGSGEGGGQIYVDGFSGGRFPPKEDIREIRINANPFSAQYPDLGLGRVEISTKPGTGKLHGDLQANGSADRFNAPNPYTGGVQPPYYLLFTRGSLSGPLGKKTSLFGSGNYNDQQNNAVVNAFNPDGTPLSLAVAAPTTEATFSLRLDRQLTPGNTFVARYEFDRSTAKNLGVGLLVLPSAGSSNTTGVQTLQLSNSEVLGAHIVSDTRFQYLRTRIDQDPNSSAPAIVVQGAFSNGGAPTQSLHDSSDAFEFQEYLSFDYGKHFLRAGARYRLLHETNLATAGYQGQFTFPNLAAFAANTPSLFNLTAGQPTASILTGDLAVYAEDEWKPRQDLTLTYGLRLESQTDIPDHFDPAPRAGLAWAVRQTGKHPALFVLRANAGIFYDRFANGNILTSVRENGISQQAFFITNPTFYPNIPAPSQLSGTAPTPYTISPHLHAASESIASVAVERSFGKIGSVTLSYYAVRGLHQYNSENINAPLPGTVTAANPGGTRPTPGSSDIYQFASDGVEKAQSLALKTSLQPTKHLSLFAYYGTRRQTSDTFGAASFPSDPYHVSADLGPSGLGMQAIGQRLFADATYKLPLGFSADLFLATFSRSRFNITTGTDRNGDTQFNDRPAFATAPGPTSVLYNTAFGRFDANPQPGETIIPYNYARAPRFAFVELGLSRDFKFGPRPAPPAGAPALPPGKGPAPKPEPAYDLSFSVDAINLLNENNGGAPVGVLSSPYFGRSISLNSLFGANSSSNRTLFLQTSFRF